jgi:DNA phosphorothioation-associated putative methyltransferase
MKVEHYKAAVKTASIGKKLPDALYVHRSALGEDSLLLMYLGMAWKLAGTETQWNLAKFDRHKAAISLLWYPGFETEAHPAQHNSVHVNLQTGKVTPRSYANAKNAPILHRKELFVSDDYPLREEFIALTEQEEDIGLLKECSKVGFRNQWELRCAHRGVSFEGNRLLLT